MQCLISCLAFSSYLLVLFHTISILQLPQLFDGRVCRNELPETLTLPSSMDDWSLAFSLDMGGTGYPRVLMLDRLGRKRL